jgi:flagellin-like protein
LKKSRKFRLNRKAVSPVIAVLLMIAIAVAASVLVYVWSMGLIGTLQTGGGQQVREQIELDAYAWNSTGLTLYLRNVGSSNVVVDAIYIEGVQKLQGATTLNVQGPAVKVTVAGATGYTDGVAYTIKIVTKTGGVFTFSCIYGHAG